MNSKLAGQKQIMTIIKFFIFLIFSVSFVEAETSLTANKVFHKAKKDVVKISRTSRNKVFGGTGFVVRDQATGKPVLFTAYHVVQGFKPDLSNISVSTRRENSLKIKKILSYSKKLDLILFELESYAGSGLKLAKQPVYDRALMYIVGYPSDPSRLESVKGTSFHLPRHRTLAYITSLNGYNFEGTSGGPILNSDGEVIGINLQENRVYEYMAGLKSSYLNQFMSEPMPQRKWLSSNSIIPSALYLRENPFLSKTVFSQLQQLADTGSVEAQNMLSRLNQGILFDAQIGTLVGSLALMNLFVVTFLDVNTVTVFLNYAGFVLSSALSVKRCSDVFRHIRNKASLSHSN